MTPKTLLTLKRFQKDLLKKIVSKSDSKRESFLNSIALPNLSSKIVGICESKTIKNPNNCTSNYAQW